MCYSILVDTKSINKGRRMAQMLIDQQNLKALRKLANLSQQQIAEYCKLNRSIVSKAEAMDNVKINIVSKLSAFYVDYFKALKPYLPKAKQDELDGLIPEIKI